MGDNQTSRKPVNFCLHLLTTAWLEENILTFQLERNILLTIYQASSPFIDKFSAAVVENVS